MLIQNNLKINIETDHLKQRLKKKHKSSFAEDRIKKILAEWNTIADVELYKSLYDICTQLFLATQNNKLECLNYYIDHERDYDIGEEFTIMYAEIKDTWELPMKERYQKHLELLKRVISQDITLIHNESTIYKEEGQLSIFN